MNFLCTLLPILGIGTLVGITTSIKDYTHERIFKNGDIILGGIFPLHLVKGNKSCSDLRSSVLILSEAMIYAIEEISKDGKILQNVSLGYDIRDTCGNEQEGVSIASDFVYENTLKFDPRFIVTNSCRAEVTTSKPAPLIAVIGGLDSRVSVNVANVLQVEDVPQISYGASSAELATSDFTSFFRTVPVDTFQSQAMAEFIGHYQWTCVAVIGVDDFYGRSGVAAFVTAANETGICIVFQELFPVHDSEVRIQKMITTLKSMEHVQIIILYSLVPQAVMVFEEAVKQDFTGRTWIASDGWSESSVIQQSRFKPIIQGAIGFGFHAFRFGDFENYVTKEPCSGQERISQEMYKRDFNNGGVAYVRDAVYAIARGLSKLLNCDAKGPECSAESLSALRPDDLLTSLRKLSFKGITGQINFRKGVVEAAYDIFNLQETKYGGFNLVQIGNWSEGSSGQKLNVLVD
ncbi:hypothetical protein OS493_008605 [Desmophyllum pertusum]|uniref:Receptor ligand binding region domain-containing protein n=1 Tax=Desmophyllum pertusum TaxID=174260 RepID=A0A9X0D5I7_9CNID|nr:hypothetical protein OS493_008605 [Desmophyllum pertusum]